MEITIDFLKKCYASYEKGLNKTNFNVSNLQDDLTFAKSLIDKWGQPATTLIINKINKEEIVQIFGNENMVLEMEVIYNDFIPANKAIIVAFNNETNDLYDLNNSSVIFPIR